MAKAKLAFFTVWALLWAMSQLPLLVLFSAVQFNPTVVTIAEVSAAVLTVMITVILMAKEDYNGEEIRNTK